MAEMSEVAEYFSQRKYITAVHQVVYSEGMSAQMGMQSCHARALRQPCEQQFYGVCRYRLAGT